MNGESRNRVLYGGAALFCVALASLGRGDLAFIFAAAGLIGDLRHIFAPKAHGN